MQRVIKGVLYDTDNSVLIYFDENKGRRYYMTPRSHFFVMFATGEIQVVSIDAMKDILGTYDIEKYIEIFGEPTEG